MHGDLGIKDKPGTGTMDSPIIALPKGDLLSHEVGNIRPLEFGRRKQVVREGERLNTSAEAGDELALVLGMPQRLAGNRLYHRQGVFHSMVEFIDQQPLQSFGALALRDVASNLGRPDDCAPFVVKRRNGEGYIEASAVFRNTNRFVVLDALASFEPRKNLPLLLVQFRRGNARDRLSDHLACIIAEHTVRAAIP
jgi:hypothetical protein